MLRKCLVNAKSYARSLSLGYLVHFFNMYVLNTYYVQGTVLNSGNKADKNYSQGA